MYEVERKFYPPAEFLHSDTMYRIYNENAHPEPANVSNEVNSGMLARLNLLETSVSQLFNIVQRASKSIEDEKPMSVRKFETNSGGVATPLIFHANPENPPLVVLLYSHVLSMTGCEFSFFSHKHSSVISLPLKLKQVIESINSLHRNRTNGGITIRFIWTSSLPDCLMLTNTNSDPLYGEMTAVFNLLELFTHVDDRKEQREILQTIYLSLKFDDEAQIRNILTTLSKHKHFAHPQRVMPSTADCLLYVTIQKKQLKEHIPIELHDWMCFCSNFESFKLIAECIQH